MFKHGYWVGILLCVLPVTSSAATLSWEQVKAEAIANAEDMAINRTDQAITLTETKEAKSDYYPQIRLRASIEHVESLQEQQRLPPIAVVGGTSIVGGTFTQVSPGATATWTLFDGGQRKRRVLASRQRLVQKEEASFVTERDLLLKALAAYTDSLNAQIRREHYQSLHNVYDALMVATKRLFEAGLIRKTEIATTALDLYATKEALAKADADWKIALTQLTTATHVFYDADNTEIEPWLEPVTLDTAPLPDELPEFRQYMASIKEKEIEIERLKRERWSPTITAYSNLNLYGRDNDKITRALNNVQFTNLTIGVTAQWTLFDGFKLSAQTERLALEKVRLLQERDKATRLVLRDRALAEANYKAAQQLQVAQEETKEIWALNANIWDRLDAQQLVRHTDALKQRLAQEKDTLNQKLSRLEQMAAGQRLACYTVGVP
jgi:outer membrane protein TolC